VAEKGWAQIEYEEIHRYGRTVYETIFRLMQATFVINPALAAGYYYVFYDKPDALHEMAPFGLGVAVLGVVYNFGASRVYRSSHLFLEQLLIRMKEIDLNEGLKAYEAVQLTAPRSYVRYWQKHPGHMWQKGNWRRFFSADRWTRLFLGLLMLGWLVAALFAIHKVRSHI
jgi:hypothetical protein